MNQNETTTNNTNAATETVAITKGEIDLLRGLLLNRISELKELGAQAQVDKLDNLEARLFTVKKAIVLAQPVKVEVTA